MSEAFTIIQTKLCQPPLQADFIPRPQLLEQLEGWQQRPLTLVSATAGYGKSTLVSSWLEALECPTAWLSLDEHDKDLDLFLTYFLACVQTSFPDAVAETAALLGGAELPPLRGASGWTISLAFSQIDLATAYCSNWEARWGTVGRPLLWSHAMHVVLWHALS